MVVSLPKSVLRLFNCIQDNNAAKREREAPEGLRRALIRIRSVIRARGRKRRLILTFKLRPADEWTFASAGGCTLVILEIYFLANGRESQFQPNSHLRGQ